MQIDLNGTFDIMSLDRLSFASGDWVKGTADEYVNEASVYIGCTGSFHVDEEKQTLTRSMLSSLFPNWIGQTQPRAVRVEGDLLNLSRPARSSRKARP